MSDSHASELPKFYGFSTYCSALLKWWRAILTMVTLIVINLVLQTLLMYPYDAVPIGPVFWLKATLSGVTFYVVWGIMISASLQLYKGRVSLTEAVRHFAAHWLNFLVWFVVWIVVCTFFSLFNLLPGIVAVFISFYVLFAAVDGQRNAIVANFKAIASRPVRYFFTAIATSVLIFCGLYLVGGLTLFSSPNLHGVWVAWLFTGLIGSWMTVAWGLLYRSTMPGAPQDAVTSVTTTEPVTG